MSVLSRKAFAVSRLAEFASAPELVRQTGHPIERWPQVIVKECVDNALDAAEEAGTAPQIHIAVEADGSITVADMGPGIASETVRSIVDYTKRTSSRAAYVSPTRGAQGNALQTIVAMGFALNGRRGEPILETRSVAHRIVFTVDPVRQIPIIDHHEEPSPVKIGTRVTARWPDSASWILAKSRDDFLQLVSTYVWLNPHLTLDCEWRGGGEPDRFQAAATNPAWSKWRPSMPTCAHWYDVQSLARLMAVEIAYAEDQEQPCPTVREFVSQFRGLSGTAKGKSICEAIGASRQSLVDFHALCEERTGALLTAMQEASKPVKPRDLGSIGRDHLGRCFAAKGGDPDTFDYRMSAFEHAGLPYVMEAAFGYAPSLKETGRVFVSGLNFSPAIGADPFRNLGPGRSLDGLLAEQWADSEEPVVVFVHLTTPRLNFLDKGKTQIALQ